MKRYRTIVADPPWAYESMTPPWYSGSVPAYDLMPLEAIKALPVADLAERDAHLYLWAVLPMMAEAYEVVRAWDFTPSTVVTWCKPGPGLGGGWRGNTEHLIVARRGDSFYNPSCRHCHRQKRGARRCTCADPEWIVKGRPYAPTVPFQSTTRGTWFQAPRLEHSQKPELFLDLIEQMSPGPRLELFARRARFGWDVWGDESLGTAEMVA